jgi:thioredoxin-like negative regulator of GroEL
MITNVTEDNFQQEVEGHAGRVLIDFYTPTCPPCRAFAPTLEQTGKIKVVKIDASVEGQLAAEFDITAVPTFVLLDSGEKKAQLTGARSKKDFEKWLDEN